MARINLVKPKSTIKPVTEEKAKEIIATKVEPLYGEIWEPQTYSLEYLSRILGWNKEKTK